ncbi:tetratricopeptide repeat protein [Desulfocurvus sp.]|jgi:tetratricopeptide (TPR) repeat protein|uniref:tetratricopeptide repeat protein n=1 Tax=Desulfocurvus sp. TaxID=2871698 RepID=UPI0025C6F328|nr:tetratricopeptide repeat protein [Desulfocurvus sp.]MCK9239245.1 tetratricopeptide repeat protein [Desulfocurvus sp.]
MITKINWFKEVLELEPGSKVFFPLARLYFEDGNHAEAMTTLRQGLSRNPDHIEARFLLVEILSRLERDEEAAQEVGAITAMLSRYPAFWRVWAESAAPGSKDSALALSFLAASFQGEALSWSRVIEKGLDAIFHGNGAAPAPQAEAPGAPEADAPAQRRRKPAAPARRAAAETDPTIRTRTMADLLADQGDFQGALDIYSELADKASGHEADELTALIEKMRLKLRRGPADGAGPDDADPGAPREEERDQAPEPGPDAPAPAEELPGKDKLLETLQALAERLEARAAH